MKTVLLDKALHNRNGFDCGNDLHNNFLKIQANQQSKKDNSRTFVLEDDADSSIIIGFYTLTMTWVDLSLFPSKLQSKHKSSTSAGLLARLAVDINYARKGFGEWLLIDALKKFLHASELVGYPYVVVDAKDGAKDFYLKFGFIPFINAPNRLFMTMDNIRIILQSIK